MCVYTAQPLLPYQIRALVGYYYYVLVCLSFNLINCSLVVSCVIKTPRAEKRRTRTYLELRFRDDMGFAIGKEGGHLVSFLLGAAIPTALLFFLASDRLGEGLSRISLSWGNGTMTLVGPAPEVHNQDHEVRIAYAPWYKFNMHDALFVIL